MTFSVRRFVREVLGNRMQGRNSTEADCRATGRHRLERNATRTTEKRDRQNNEPNGIRRTVSTGFSQEEY